MTQIGHNGGPAFPQKRTYRDSQGIDHEVCESGLSLRDYMAIHADGLDNKTTVNYAAQFNPDPTPGNGDYLAWAKWFAKADANLRYMRADAMIAARGDT